MSYLGFKHSQATKDLLSQRMQEFYTDNPDAAVISGQRMRAGRQMYRPVKCPWCWDEFESYLGKGRACPDCRPIDALDVWLRRTYGIGFYDYQEMFLAQDGKCAICRSPGRREGFRLHVDHDHKTRKIRGLLCSDCNLVLGKMNDRIDLLKAAVTYLEKSARLTLRPKKKGTSQ